MRKMRCKLCGDVHGVVYGYCATCRQVNKDWPSSLYGTKCECCGVRVYRNTVGFHQRRGRGWLAYCLWCSEANRKYHRERPDRAMPDFTALWNLYYDGGKFSPKVKPRRRVVEPYSRRRV